MNRQANRIAALAAVIALSAAAFGATRSEAGAPTGAPASGSLDIEFAVDSTGSMQTLIERAQKDAQGIVDAVRAFDQDARFAVVAFRDVGYPAPEYDVLQRFTTNTAAVKTAIGRLKAVTTDNPGNVASEAYNLVFDRSVSDSKIGWRSSSRKVVIVIGDAEPHNAGAVGLRGCKNTNPDPRGLNTADVLAKMRAAGRTLLMLRQEGIDSTLECHSSIAALAAPGSAARNSGSADLVGPIRALLEGSAVSLEAVAGFPLSLPGSTRTFTFKIQNRSGGPAGLELVSLQLPADTSLVSATGLSRTQAANGRTITWSQVTTLAPGKARTLVVKVRFGTKAGARRFRVIAKSKLADDLTITSVGVSSVRVGRSLGLKIVSGVAPNRATGSLSFSYPASASSLRGSTTARGVIRLGAKSNLIAVRLNGARITSAAAQAAVTARGVVTTSNRASCRIGTTVTVRLVDQDVIKARSVPDVIRVVGKGCGTVAAGDVVTR